MKRLLVTGGAGFIGSNFIRFSLDKYPDLEIINLDKLTYCGNPKNLSNLSDCPRYKFIKGDICDKAVVREVMKDADAVINFAAESHVDRSIKDPGAFLNTNVFGTLTLLDAAKELPNIKKFVQISTDEVYGSIKKGSTKEDHSLFPNSPYAASKASADLLARSFFVTFKLPVTIVRSSNNFGPYQYPEKVIPLFVTNLIENKSVPLYGTGKNVREWLYVMDNCAGIDLALRRGKSGEIYNIGSGNEKDNLTLANLILRSFGKDRSFIQFVNDRPGHDLRYSLNSNKLRRLGWKPKMSFKEALRETIDWYKNNQSWWKDIKEKADIVKW